MRSDSVKNMSAYADQNHAPSLTDVRLEPVYVWISDDRRNMQVTVDEHTGGVAWEKDRLREWVESIEIVEWIRNIENAGEGSFIGKSVCFLPEPCFWVQGLRDFMAIPCGRSRIRSVSWKIGKRP